MKLIVFLFKRYILTLVTSVVILCLTFYKPVGIVRTNTVVEIDKVVHFIMYFFIFLIYDLKGKKDQFFLMFFDHLFPNASIIAFAATLPAPIAEITVAAPVTASPPA